MVSTFSRVPVWINRVWYQSCPWSAEPGKCFFSLFPFVPENFRPRETGSVVPSGFSVLILYTQTESGDYSLASSFLSLSATASTYTTNCHRVRHEFIRSRNCVPMALLPRVRRHWVSSPQGSSSSGCCLFRFHHGPILYAPLLQHPLLV